MKILLISYNKEEIPIPVKPVGLAYIANALIKNNHDVELLDLRFCEETVAAITEKINYFGPEVVGINIRNIDSGCLLEPSFYINQLKYFVDIIKDCNNTIPIILGGGGFSLMPLQILKYSRADYGIVGEGEVAFNRFLKAYERGMSFEDVPSLAYKKEGKFIVNQQIKHENIELLELKNIFDKGYYSPECKSKTNRPLTEGILSKRGCVYKCNYCGTPLYDGNKVRCYDVKTVVDNMEQVLKENSNEVIFEFLDNVINYPVSHLDALCNEMLRRETKFKWMCIATPQLMNRDNVALMKKAGCISIELGIESFSDPMLTAMDKPFNKADSVRAVELCNEVGISSFCDIMLGGPGENFNTLKETFDTIEKIKPGFVLFNFGIRIFPGVSIAEIAIKEGVIKPDDDLLAPKFYVSSEIDERGMKLIEDNIRKNPRQFYLCREIFQHKLSDCVQKSMNTWKEIEDSLMQTSAQ